jgi:3-keto-5-aminohexanoate cleavage enzyme
MIAAAKPMIMVAPNGARLQKTEHPCIPITIAEIVNCAIACRDAGADAIHAHVRDDLGRHSLDHGLYRDLLLEMERQCAGFPVQITTETAGIYTAGVQRNLIHALLPARVSMAVREQFSDDDLAAARTTYHEAAEAGIELQHILYSPDDLNLLEAYMDAGIIPEGLDYVLFVLGRYGTGIISHPSMVDLFLSRMQRPFRWMVCAFGQTETECLQAAASRGGNVRVGFENNIHNSDGTLASSNAERVADFRRSLEAT